MPLNRLNSSGWWKWSELYSHRNKVLNYGTSLWYFNDSVRALLVWGGVRKKPRWWEAGWCCAWCRCSAGLVWAAAPLDRCLSRDSSLSVCSCQTFNDGRGNEDLKNFLRGNITGKWRSEPFIPLFLHSWEQPLIRDSVGKSGSMAWLKKRGISVWKDAQKWGQGSSAVIMVCQMCRDLRDWALRLSQQTHMWVCISVGVAYDLIECSSLYDSYMYVHSMYVHSMAMRLCP